MLANMKAKKYCLHPGRIKTEDFVKDDDGKPTEKKMECVKYISAKDLIRYYGVDEADCVTWGPSCVGVDHLVHLKPDREGRYELPKVVAAPVKRHRKSKSQR